MKVDGDGMNKQVLMCIVLNFDASVKDFVRPYAV